MFRPVSSALRSSRESLCSEVSTSSSCTGEAVWVTLIVSPESSVGEPGVPGLRSTKKLPSRKMRGRTLAVASSCSGSAESLSSIVISAAFEPSTPVDGLDLADLDARDPHRRVGPDRVRRLELRLDLEAVRERDVLGEAEEQDERGEDQPHQADEGVRAARGVAAGAGHHLRLRVALGPGLLRARDVGRDRLAGQELLVAGLALTRLARRGGVRVRVGVQVVGLQRAVGRRRRRSALVVRALRRGDDDEALPGAVAVADAEQRGDVAEPQRQVVADRLGGREVVERRAQRLHQVGRCARCRAGPAGRRRRS